jgi:hypothetical protein
MKTKEVVSQVPAIAVGSIDPSNRLSVAAILSDGVLITIEGRTQKLGFRETEKLFGY